MRVFFEDAEPRRTAHLNLAANDPVCRTIPFADILRAVYGRGGFSLSKI
jgi:hypothetical protein